MSDPAPKQESDLRPRFQRRETLTAEQIEQLDRSAIVDAEAYMQWLETGEGPEPYAEYFD